MLKYSDNEFKDIKGEKIKSDQSWNEDYQSGFAMEGAKENIISSTGWISFIATYPATTDSAAAVSAFNKMTESIKKALGDKATATASEEEKQITNSTSAKFRKILFRKHDGDLTAYYVELELKKATRKLDILRSLTIEWTIRIAIYQKLE